MNRDFSEWYERVYPRLVGHGLWLRGGEPHTLPPAQYGRRPFRVLFARLSTYQDTAESFTHTMLYAIARSVPGVFPDLAYLPPRHDLSFFVQDRVPWLLGTQTKRGPLDFDVIGFSNSIVQELINLPSLLTHSGIPLGKRERMKDASIPLILLGGANALHTSVFWIDDPPVDGIFVGEAEEQIARILAICREGKKKRETKARILKKLEAVPGFFQPDGGRKTTRHIGFPEEQGRAVLSYPVPLVPGRAGEGHLQISEGCPCFCSFCSESYGRKPYREYPVEVVIRRALAMKAAMGLESLDLYSFNFNMHSGFYRILWELAPLFASVGLKSQRLDFITHDPGLLGFIHAVGKSSLTCGIEGISERLRRYLNKNLPDEILGPGLKAVLKAPIRELKIFLIATGLENEEDFGELKDLLEFVTVTLQYAERRPRIIFSVTPLVRFPWTPLEFADAFPVEHLKPIVDRIRERIRGRGFEFRQAAELDDYWLSQVLVRASDPRIYAALLRAIEESGFVYFQDLSAEFTRAFRRHLAESGLAEEGLLRGTSFDESLARPWAGIRTGMNREFLLARYKLAKSFKEADYCLGRGRIPGQCGECGACPDPDHVRTLTHAGQQREHSLEQFRRRLAGARQDEAPLGFVVDVSERGAGLDRRFVGTALAGAVMQADPETVSGYRRFGGSYWDREGQGSWVVGDDVLTLYWSRSAAARVRDRMTSAEYRRKINREMDGWGTVRSLVPASGGEWELAIQSPFPFDGQRYFESRGMRFTLRKIERETYRREFSKDSLKKRIMTGLELTRRGDGCELRVVPGPKFDAKAFLCEAFSLTVPEDWIRIRARACLKPSSL